MLSWQVRNHNMEQPKPTFNVRYVVEVKDATGSTWTETNSFYHLDLAIKDIEIERKLLPQHQFRLIRSERELIG